MPLVINIALGLATTLIGYMVGRIWQKAVDQIPYRRARRFWASVITENLEIVVSRFKLNGFTEPTGIVGGGDALAMRELGSLFSSMGVKKFDIKYVDEPSVDRESNLILIGGPESNKVTRDALEIVKPRLKIFDPGPGSPIEVHDYPLDLASGGKSSQVAPAPQKYLADLGTDYAVIVRARNPFNRQKGLIIIAGAYGYGTWGAVRLVTDEGFLEKCEELETASTPTNVQNRHICRRTFDWIAEAVGVSNRHSLQMQPQLECLVRVRVFDGRPYTPEIILLRILPETTG